MAALFLQSLQVSIHLCSLVGIKSLFDLDTQIVKYWRIGLVASPTSQSISICDLGLLQIAVFRPTAAAATALFLSQIEQLCSRLPERWYCTERQDCNDACPLWLWEGSLLLHTDNLAHCLLIPLQKTQKNTKSLCGKRLKMHLWTLFPQDGLGSVFFFVFF